MQAMHLFHKWTSSKYTSCQQEVNEFFFFFVFFESWADLSFEVQWRKCKVRIRRSWNSRHKKVNISGKIGGCETVVAAIAARRNHSPIYTNESQKNINLLPSKRRFSVAKHVHSSVTIFPLRNGRRDEERIALFPISVLLLVTHSSRRPIDLNFTRSFRSALPQRHQPFIHNWVAAKWMLDNW